MGMETNGAESYSDKVSQIQESEKKDTNLQQMLKITRQDLLVTQDQNKELTKEVSTLRNKLLIYEKIRRKEKEEYDKNLSNLGSKLLHFESQLRSEQQDIEQLLLEKDKEIKAQEDLIGALRRSLNDKPICKTCNCVNESTDQLKHNLYKPDTSLHTIPEDCIDILGLKSNLSLPLLSYNTESPIPLIKSCHSMLSPVPEELECSWSEQGSPVTPICHSRLPESLEPSLKEINDCDNLIENFNDTDNNAAILDEGLSILEQSLSGETLQKVNKCLQFDDINTIFEVKIILDQIIERVQNKFDDNSSLSESQFVSDEKVGQMLNFDVRETLKEMHDNETESSLKVPVDVVNSQSSGIVPNFNADNEEDTYFMKTANKNNIENSFVYNNIDFNHGHAINKKCDEPDETESENSSSSSSSEGILAVELSTSSNDDTSNSESTWHDNILDIDNIDFDISDNISDAKNPLDVIFPLTTSESNIEVLNGISTGLNMSSECTNGNLVDLDKKLCQPENIADGLLNPLHVLLPLANNETLISDNNLEEYDVIELENGL